MQLFAIFEPGTPFTFTFKTVFSYIAQGGLRIATKPGWPQTHSLAALCILSSRIIDRLATAGHCLVSSRTKAQGVTITSSISEVKIKTQSLFLLKLDLNKSGFQ